MDDSVSKTETPVGHEIDHSRPFTLGADRETSRAWHDKMVSEGRRRYVFDDDPNELKWDDSSHDPSAIRIRACCRCGCECVGRILSRGIDQVESPIVCPACYTTQPSRSFTKRF